MANRAYTGRIGLEGVLMVLSPLPVYFVASEEKVWVYSIWSILAVISSSLIFASAVTLLRRPAFGKVLGIIGVIPGYVACLHFVLSSQVRTLAVTVLFIGAFFSFLDFQRRKTSMPSTNKIRAVTRAFWGILSLLPFLLIDLLFSGASLRHVTLVIAVSSVIAFGLYLYCALIFRSFWRLGLVILFLGLLGGELYLGNYSLCSLISLGISLLLLLLLPRKKDMVEYNEQWWEVLLSHPARVLLTTFLLLCLFGTLLLLIPQARYAARISVVDALFTSVSAVCVTGLVVLDTPLDFTVFGQSFILLLIQLGGLGIMSITTVALHAMGRRLSLKQERLMTSMTDTPHRDLIDSLVRILKYTFVVEGAGALILGSLFYSYGDGLGYAAYRGLFTAVSAFCNAGFALQSDSLMAYQGEPLILHTVALLIILGGIAPATVLFVPRWLSGKVTPIPARIALVTTIIMLVCGTLFVVIFEWNGFLTGMTFWDKLQNAWFQSVTLRTAGFNSVDLSHCESSTYLVMLAFMFIGGSPGGTAGGVKTTTIGILALTFWTNIMNRKQVIIQDRRIAYNTVYRAVTIVISVMIVWFVGILMLEVTQQIPARELIFEVTSAIGTVGLTIGATPQLDEIGKVVVVMIMFLGRIGPMTLFMLLSSDNTGGESKCLEEKISLT